MKVHFDRQSHFKFEVKRLVKVINKHIKLWNMTSAIGFLSVTNEEVSSLLASCYGWDSDRELLGSSRNILRYINSRQDGEVILFEADLSETDLKALAVRKEKMVRSVIKGLGCTGRDLTAPLINELYTEGLIGEGYLGASTEKSKESQFSTQDVAAAKRALFGSEGGKTVISYLGAPLKMLPISMELNERLFIEGSGGVWFVDSIPAIEIEQALLSLDVSSKDICAVDLYENGMLSSELLTEGFVHSVVCDYLDGRINNYADSHFWIDRHKMVFSVILRQSWKVEPSIGMLLNLTSLDALIDSLTLNNSEDVRKLLSSLPCMDIDDHSDRYLPSPQSYELWGYSCMGFTKVLEQMSKMFSTQGGRLLNQADNQHTILSSRTPEVSAIVKRALALEMAGLVPHTRIPLFVEVGGEDTSKTLLALTRVTTGRVNFLVDGIGDSRLDCLKSNSHLLIAER
ncbi:hypothetical protein VCHA53O466_50420 [Vibrio chagasii]|nr:hypothetical protein VCHA53O466_50420 [Vibrio chagasii]